MIVQNWYPQATGNAVLDQILKKIMDYLYFVQNSLSKQIASLPKSSSSSIASSDSGDYVGPSTANFPTRVFGTVYQNANLVPLFVSVTISGSSVSSGNMLATAFSDSNPSPATAVGSVNLNNTGTSSISIQAPLSFIVLPGNFYKIVGSGGAGFATWVEWF